MKTASIIYHKVLYSLKNVNSISKNTINRTLLRVFYKSNDLFVIGFKYKIIHNTLSCTRWADRKNGRLRCCTSTTIKSCPKTNTGLKHFAPRGLGIFCIRGQRVGGGDQTHEKFKTFFCKSEIFYYNLIFTNFI